MRKHLKCKKFVAFIDEAGYQWDRTGFYLIDVDTWNKGGYVPDQNCYLEDVYLALEALGDGCRLSAENHFWVKKELKNVDDLNEFLKPLPWIVAVDAKNRTYVDPSKLKNFTNKIESICDVIKAYDKRIVVDEAISNNGIDEPLSIIAQNDFDFYARKNGVPNEYFTSGNLEKCKIWLEKYAQEGKVIFCIPEGTQRAIVYAFDNVETINKVKSDSRAYQKLSVLLERKRHKNKHLKNVDCDNIKDAIENDNELE